MKKQIIILSALLLLCIGVGAYSGYKIYREAKEVKQAEELSAEFNYLAPSISLGLTETGAYEALYKDFMPKLSELKAANGDAAGWIWIPQTNISYPLMQGQNNTYYLNHSVSRQYSAAGSVFIDKRGLGTANTVIYGHNMGRSSNVMFHDLTNFADPNWFEKAKAGYIITEGGVTELEIFAYSLTETQSGYYNREVSLDYIRNNALHFREPAAGGQLYTLSTCDYSGKNARAVLSCMGKAVYTLD